MAEFLDGVVEYVNRIKTLIESRAVRDNFSAIEP